MPPRPPASPARPQEAEADEDRAVDDLAHRPQFGAPDRHEAQKLRHDDQHRRAEDGPQIVPMPPISTMERMKIEAWTSKEPGLMKVT